MKSASMATNEALRLCFLPVDAQASILSFLPHGDLARFSQVSRGSQGVATMDRLWRPLFARRFCDVMIPVPLQSSTARQQFRALALSLCSICGERILCDKLRDEPTRYSNPHSCSVCGSLLCAKCYCRCHYLNLECTVAVTGALTYCEECYGRAHCACQQLFQCGTCDMILCLICGDFTPRSQCGSQLCRGCECDDGICDKCDDYSE
jgi:hypothetical protein